MGATGVHAGIYGVALVRAADAMLQALGGDSAILLFPAATLPNDPSAQLGLVDPGVSQVAVSPVVARNLATATNGPRRRVEFLISASVLSSIVVSQNAANAGALFDSALGIMLGGDLLHIESFAAESFAGTDYLYRVVAVE